MEEEMQALVDNEIWDLLPPIPHKKTISCRWIYKIKHNADETINWYKARLVSNIFAETHDKDDYYLNGTCTHDSKRATSPSNGCEK